MKRLFISTKESYIPPYKIIGANYIKAEGLQVYVETDDPNYKGKAGYITCSDENEAHWFTKAIFSTLDNPKDIVIDFISKSIYTINNTLKDVCFVFELNDPSKMLQDAQDQDAKEIPDKQETISQLEL